MKLFYSPSSPYVRKVIIVALETGLNDRIERLPAQTTPIAPNPDLKASAPLAKVPTLVTDSGLALFDSRVIAEYLDSLHSGPKFFPAGDARWPALRNHALGDGLLDAALLVRYEGFLRPEALRWSEWSSGQWGKVEGALADIEAQADGLGDTLDIGTVAIGCALGYLDFRFGDSGWRTKFPKAAALAGRLGKRPSFATTVPG
ncbi:MAG: glutathione S-transferase [Pseudomonadota bacterium]|nr:glutathione S-transferase [Pseudomonadota bacterium]